MEKNTGWKIVIFGIFLIVSFLASSVSAELRIYGVRAQEKISKRYRDISVKYLGVFKSGPTSGVRMGEWCPSGFLPKATLVDTTGSSIITWLEFVGEGGWYPERAEIQLCAKKLDSNGNMLWTRQVATFGKYLSGNPHVSSYFYGVISDGEGGIILSWLDETRLSRSIYPAEGILYVQKIDSGCARSSIVVNRVICPGRQGWEPDMVSDRNGGCIIVWSGFSGCHTFIYGQRINRNGLSLWGSGIPIRICRSISIQEYPRLIEDGSGGAIITWVDRRGGSEAGVYTQRINSEGTLLWQIDGVPVCDRIDVTWQTEPQIVADGSGGAIISWITKYYNSTREMRILREDIQLNKIDSEGHLQWRAYFEEGILIDSIDFSDSRDRLIYKMITDTDGGVIIMWRNRPSGYGPISVRVQRVDGSGIPLWPTDGIVIDTGSSYPSIDHLGTNITSDGDGGVIIVWTKLPNILLLKKIDSNGFFTTPDDGELLSTSCSGDVPEIVSDNYGNCIVVWNYGRRILGQRLDL